MKKKQFKFELKLIDFNANLDNAAQGSANHQNNRFLPLDHIRQRSDFELIVL